MTYLYEQLSPERFQQFCQSLLAVQFPNAQCLPVGQPDGGRDAFLWSMRDPGNRPEELIVFQVKFSRDPTRADSDFLKSIVETELPKVERLKKKGLTAYYLLTNVSGSAHLTEEQLKSLLRDYLSGQGHKPSLVDDLFVGMVERVVALVSRVQGTFEFEVQPLREYFAARHLYETAPYSPPGQEKRGTKPERFDALSRNAYWLNVTRFYCGCYSRGELSSLADGLIELSEAENYKETSYPRLLMLMLLGDWVFTQQPLTVGRLVKAILGEPGFKVLLSTLHRQGSISLIAPERCGRTEIVDGCVGILEKSAKTDVAIMLARSIREALIEAAQSQLAKQAGSKAKAPGAVARSERWFR